MDVSPIAAIRPAEPVRALHVTPDLSRVFEVEYLGQSGEDEYRHSDPDQVRGMEDEEDDSAGSADPDLGVDQNVARRSSVNCFA